jgi:hypothetical protein
MITHMTMRTTISMPDEIWDQVNAQHTETGASTSEIVRRALVCYFETDNGKISKRTASKRAVKAAPTRPRPARAARPAKRASKRPAKVA